MATGNVLILAIIQHSCIDRDIFQRFIQRTIYAGQTGAQSVAQLTFDTQHIFGNRLRLQVLGNRGFGRRGSAV